MSRTLERGIVNFCAPTLAKLKPASMFSFHFGVPGELYSQLEACRAGLAFKGVNILLLRMREHSALIYVYRRGMLQFKLDAPGVGDFLRRYNYKSTDAEAALRRLRARFSENNGFPHEIGVFLGYPLADVEGFIENRGGSCKCAGLWKVYGDPKSALSTFESLRRCSEAYQRLWSQGRTLCQLTVQS